MYFWQNRNKWYITRHTCLGPATPGAGFGTIGSIFAFAILSMIVHICPQSGAS